MAYCSQLSINEREEISLGLAQGFSKNYIALSLGRSSSTICREVNRNTANGQAYRAVKAQHRANKLRHFTRKNRKIDINIPLKHYVLEQLDNYGLRIAANYGGGMWVCGSSSTICDNIISGNVAYQGSGIVVYWYSSLPYYQQ